MSEHGGIKRGSVYILSLISINLLRRDNDRNFYILLSLLNIEIRCSF